MQLMRRLNISLDYDNTYTADPKGMKALIRCLQSSGHTVFCVTMRHAEIDWNEDFKELKEKYDVETIFCDGRAKRKVTQDRNIGIDIWIDDTPKGVDEDSPFTGQELLDWRIDQGILKAA